MNTFKADKKVREIYISVDIEATGPIPGKYSMSSLGAFMAGGLYADGTYFTCDHTDKDKIFYAELAPISDAFIPAAINVGLLEGFDTSIPDPTGERHFEWMKEHGQSPEVAMDDFADWVNDKREQFGARPVFTAYPASFDWTFVYWYFINHDIESPFGFSAVLDMKTVFSVKKGKGLTRSTKRNMPKHLFPDLPHTHRADDDALEQGIMAMNMLMWNPDS